MGIVTIDAAGRVFRDLLTCRCNHETEDTSGAKDDQRVASIVFFFCLTLLNFVHRQTATVNTVLDFIFPCPLISANRVRRGTFRGGLVLYSFA